MNQTMTNLVRELRCFNPLTGKRDGGYCVWEGEGKCQKCQAADKIEELEAQVKELEELSKDLLNQLQRIRAGHTKTVEYDLSPAMVESALRDKLIELGWTPPTELEDKHQFTKGEGYCKHCIEKDKRILNLEAAVTVMAAPLANHLDRVSEFKERIRSLKSEVERLQNLLHCYTDSL